MNLKPLKVMLNIAAKTFKKYKYSSLEASQTQKLPPTDGPPTFSSNLRSYEAKKHGGNSPADWPPLIAWPMD